MLCRSTCPTPNTLPVPSGATAVAFRAAVPADGAYSLEAYTVDDAGHASDIVKAPFDVVRAAPPPPLKLAATVARSGRIVVHWADPPHPAPITTAYWQLCRKAGFCTPTGHGPDIRTATVLVSPGTYTLRVWLADAAGNSDSADAAALTLTVPRAASAASRAAVGFHLSTRRRPPGRLELLVSSSPKRTGRLVARLSFDGRAAETHALNLRRGSARLVVPMPNGVKRLTATLTGLGTKTTRHLRLPA